MPGQLVFGRDITYRDRVRFRVRVILWQQMKEKASFIYVVNILCWILAYALLSARLLYYD
jgi:hypothetical protein